MPACCRQVKPVPQLREYFFGFSLFTLNLRLAALGLLRIVYGVMLHNTYSLKNGFDELWKVQDKAVSLLLDEWCNIAGNLLLSPVNKFIKTLKHHWEGVLNSIITQVTNAFAEGLNSIIQLVKSRARGFRNHDNFRNMIYLLGNDFILGFHQFYRRTKKDGDGKMKMAGILFFLVVSQCHIVFAQVILTRVDSIQLPQASIWGGISFNGENITITTTNSMNGRPHLFLRKLDSSLNQIGNIIQLTMDADPQTAKRITDHKHLFLNGNHFITFSVVGDSDLYIFKTDINGQRVGSIVPVVEGTANRTNDMFFATDSNTLSVGYFKPPTQTVFHKFDQSLNQIGLPVTTSPTLPHNNIGGVVFKDGIFYMFTGNFFGKNSNLVLTRWNPDWTPAAASPQTLIQTTNGDGNWFVTGAVYDPQNSRWYLGFQHIYASDPNESEHIDIAVFDDNFVLLERQHATPSRTYRPHMLLLNGNLYVVYDSPGRVYLHKYKVTAPTGVETFQSGSLPTKFYLEQNYPNPFNPSTTIRFSLPRREFVTLKVFDVLGREVVTLVDEELNPSEHSVVFDAKDFLSGIYFYQLRAGNFIQQKKMVVLR